MATNIRGFEGNVKVGEVEFGNAKSWSLNITQETQDVSTLGTGMGWKQSIGTLKSWAGSIVAIFDSSGTVEGTLMNNLVGAGTIELTMQLGDGSGDADVYSGLANITGMDITNDVNGIMAVSFNFEGNGVLDIS